MTNPRKFSPDEACALIVDLRERIVTIEARALVRGHRVTLVPRDVPPGHYAIGRSQIRPDASIVVKMPGLARFLGGCGHMSVGGGVGEIERLELTGRVSESEVLGFAAMISEISEIAVHVTPRASFLPETVVFDVADVGTLAPWEQAVETDSNLNLSPEQRARLMEQFRTWHQGW